MKLSHGLKLLLEPLTSLSFVMSCNLFEAMRKAGKRGKNATLYPTDLRKVIVYLETVHDVTGKHFLVAVENSNFSLALQALSNWIKEEDYLIESLARIAA